MTSSTKSRHDCRISFCSSERSAVMGAPRRARLHGRHLCLGAKP
jgi:hypothetical protein